MVAVIALVAAALGAVAGGLLMRNSQQAHTPTQGTTVEQVATQSLPSVVTIHALSGSGSGSTGSGFVIRQDGYIVTNNHVAGGQGDKLSVVFQDGSEASAKLIGADAGYDLAVIKIDKSGLPVLQLGDSANLKVGQPVIAVGAPLGLTGSVTTGIVSALNRPIITRESSGGSGSSSTDGSDSSFINAIQTDAAINHGNSGGPLLDLQGRVVGVNTAIASTSSDGGSIGLGFAIPAAQVRRTTDELIRTGHADHPTIGVVVDQNFAGPGVRVQSVTSGSPADQAGIKAGDVLTSLDGEPLQGPSSFLVQLSSKAVGARITLVVTSGGNERRVTMQTASSNG